MLLSLEQCWGVLREEVFDKRFTQTILGEENQTISGYRVTKRKNHESFFMH